MKRRVVSMLLMLCLVVSLAGCGEKKQEETPPEQTETTEPAPAQETKENEA